MAALGSGALISSAGAFPQTFFVLPIANEAELAGARAGLIPVTLNGAASPMLIYAAAPAPLERISGLDYYKDCECFVTPMVAC